MLKQRILVLKVEVWNVPGLTGEFFAELKVFVEILFVHNGSVNCRRGYTLPAQRLNYLVMPDGRPCGAPSCDCVVISFPEGGRVSPVNPCDPRESRVGAACGQPNPAVFHDRCHDV